ncbi:unnamed protein product [Clonostachys byssicola]|uniref:Xylanolytic transcriptional activator regulatory domain-containing protein n=1 Tax=Clonostachys byssicola TaxID=160290 RepID=A0A9N9UTG4_9HYPO|nr:unnamed protein product [Clonostachys byssicola]
MPTSVPTLWLTGLSLEWTLEGSRVEAGALHRRVPHAEGARLSVTALGRDVGIIVLPTLESLRRIFDLFFERHFVVDFCSFEYLPTWESHYSEKPFLVASIIVLCAQYLTPEESWRAFGLKTGHDVRSHYLPVAESMARDTLTTPTVANIQGNLVLALSEILADAGSSHWLYAGTAIRMAQIMRLNKEYHQKHTTKEQEMRRRTFWACLLMDRCLAYLLSKPRTLALTNVQVALPSTNLSVAYQEQTRGINLDNLARFDGFPSEVSLSSYFIKTVCLWSDMADNNICHKRFTDTRSPLDPRSHLARCSRAVQDWSFSLPSHLEWSNENYSTHSSLGQSRTFVSLHLLLRSALCIAHQCYLPQLDGCSLLLDCLDAAGLSLLHREPSLISICISNAMALGEIVTTVWKSADSGGRLDLETIWLAGTCLPAANVFLWLQYATDEDCSREDVRETAKHYFHTIKSIFSTLCGQWQVAHGWLATLRTMEATYRAAYLGEIPPDSEIEELSPSSLSSHNGEGSLNGFKPRPGDGCPPVTERSNLYDVLRMITTESTLEELQSVWMYLAGGWSEDLQHSLFSCL